MGDREETFWFGAAEAFNTKAGSLCVLCVFECLCVSVGVSAGVSECAAECVSVCVKHANNISKSISVCA